MFQFTQLALVGWLRARGMADAVDFERFYLICGDSIFGDYGVRSDLFPGTWVIPQ